ncbi:septal ring lytic transglycosylase RlpA family protein [Rhodohalobacter sulfatireducens]|uniref:Probable endolytic peptidoglycan transglycosylase RlpA n=1 Tax=Rhodohalobacter sulfatireducens TaxID=2911366 RepID=A0ABS9KEY1_9BACT|nr:septal ring lytic transglycosylase RlpA family protein [Rhodohalobacter sulfatireducens]MCG2589380.1 septal ring lytic transglycosylase RlpA family protein [Rhodohalobacter sulfatireducens]
MSVKHSKITLAILMVVLLLITSSCGVIRRSSPPELSGSGRIIGSGIASWYGPNFHGKLTANGERYNMNDYTAAHKTLPFNTMVRVDNVENGKSVVVRINDRGPYIDNRIIDLSRKAARQIDMIGSGTASVRLSVMREGDRPIDQQNISSSETFTIQLAAFESESEANAKSSEITNSRVEKVNVEGRTIFRVYYGTYSNPQNAKVDLDRLNNKGIEGFVKQVEN